MQEQNTNSEEDAEVCLKENVFLNLKSQNVFFFIPPVPNIFLTAKVRVAVFAANINKEIVVKECN